MQLSFGATAAPLKAKKAKAALVYLALHPGEAQARDTLTTLLWEESSSALARRSLRQALVSLRQALPDPDILVADSDTLAIETGSIDVDVLEFEGLLADQSPASLERAVALYRGEFLAGFNPRSPCFEDWLMAERSRLRDRVLQAMTVLLHHYQAGLAFERAIEIGHRLLGLDPLRESAHRSLMALYARQGDNGAALRQYRSCRSVLRRELGLAPEPATDQLYRDIIARRSRPSDQVVAAENTVVLPPGQADTTANPAAPERRQSTIVAIELSEDSCSGANQRASLCDPMQRYSDRIVAEIERFGGSVVQRDHGVAVAVFGTPVARSTDSDRAVHAASAVHCAIAELNQEHNSTLHRATIGIASGQVWVSSAASSEPEQTIYGDAVELAKKLADRAASGETLLCDSVHHGVASRVSVERWVAEGPGSWSTDSLLEPAWRLLAFEPAEQDRSLEFVGRAQELHQFANAIEVCVQSGCGQAVLVRGEAGIGKTRLLKEFVSLAQERDFACHESAVLDFGTGTGQDAIRTLLRSLLRLPLKYDAQQGLAAAENALGDPLSTPAQRALLYDLLDLPKPVELRTVLDAMDNAARVQGLQSLIAWLIDAVSHHRPQLLIVEDIHWADGATLSLLNQLASTARECPLLLVSTSRVESEPLDPEWRGAMTGAPLTTIHLGPLLEQQMLRLAAQQVVGEPRSVATQVRRAGGNPLFLEQLLRAGLDDERIPDSVQSLVWARLDRFSAEAKHTAQAASVLGQRFTLEELRHLLAEPQLSCAHLIEQHLVRPIGEHYLFSHALIRDGIYASLVPSKRRELHLRAADYFRQRDDILNAEHLQQAGDQRAAAAYLDAARSQAHSYHFERALRLVQRGLLVVSDQPTEYELTCLNGELLQKMGNIDGSIEEFEHALNVADSGVKQCLAQLGIAAGLQFKDRYTDALAVLNRAEACAARHRDHAAFAQLNYQAGVAWQTLGRIEESRQAHERALAQARQANVPLLEAQALSGLGYACFLQSRMVTANGHFERCATLCRDYGFGRIEPINRTRYGLTRLFQNELQAAERETLAAIDMAAEVGDWFTEMSARTTMSVALLPSRADWHGTQQHAEQALILAQQLGSKSYEAISRSALGHALSAFGARAEAEKQFDRAYALNCQSSIMITGSVILSTLALCTDNDDKRYWALGEGERLLKGCSGGYHLRFYANAIEAMLLSGNHAEVLRYAAALEDHTRAEPVPWGDFFSTRGRALAEHVQGGRSRVNLRTLSRLRDEAERVGLKAALPALEAALTE